MRLQRLAALLLSILAGHGTVSAGESSKTFPDYRCKYTLPGKDWTWVDLESGSVLTCKARNRDGLLLSLAVKHAIAGEVIDARYAERYDEELAADGRRKKRAGRVTTFRGLPCYESEWLVNGGNSAAHRVVIADGWRYHLMLVGKGDPVERRRDFEAIMNGFEFTSPPVPPAPKKTTDPHDNKNRAAPAGDTVKTFPGYQFRYTLPGKDWAWDDATRVPKAICVASNDDGLMFAVFVVPVSADRVIDAKYADVFDTSVTAAGPAKKRGGRITTFRDLPCYQCEWLINGTRTAAVRVVIANGHSYQLHLVSDADPVEKRPDLEAIMSGFEFTAPPVPPTPKNTTDMANGEKNPAYRTGQALGYVMFALVFVRLAAWVRRRM
jgi:hypothetical protein